MIGGESVTVHRYVTDKFGDRREVSTHVVHHVAFAPRPGVMSQGSAELTDRSDQVIADAELYGPADMDIVSTDAVERPDGTLWEASGSAERWASAFVSWRPGAVVPLRRITG